MILGEQGCHTPLLGLGIEFGNLCGKMKPVDTFSVGEICRPVYSRPRITFLWSSLHALSSGFTEKIVSIKTVQEQTVQEHLIELSVGETLQVGEYTVTVVSVEGDELCFEIVNDGQDEVGEIVPQEEPELIAH